MKLLITLGHVAMLHYATYWNTEIMPHWTETYHKDFIPNSDGFVRDIKVAGNAAQLSALKGTSRFDILDHTEYTQNINPNWEPKIRPATLKYSPKS
eukprot:gene23884-biopygen9695